MMLRPLDPDRDGPALHAIFGDEGCCAYLADRATGSVSETVSLLKKWNEGTADTTWAIVDRPEGAALGRATLIPRGRDVWEVGVMVCPAMHGRGYARVALTEIIDEAFEKRSARRLYADIDPDNAPSIRLFEKLGFQREGVLRGNWRTHLGVRDSVIFGLLRDDPRPWRGWRKG